MIESNVIIHYEGIDLLISSNPLTNRIASFTINVIYQRAGTDPFSLQRDGFYCCKHTGIYLLISWWLMDCISCPQSPQPKARRRIPVVYIRNVTNPSIKVRKITLTMITALIMKNESTKFGVTLGEDRREEIFDKFTFGGRDMMRFAAPASSFERDGFDSI